MPGGSTTTKQADGGQDGRARALIALAPIEKGRRAGLRLWLALLRYLPGQGRPLMQLMFVHYLRFAVLDQLPAPGGSGRARRLSSSYLMVDACYDGGEREYLDVFTDVFPKRMAKIFGACVGFRERVVEGYEARGLSPPAFRDYVEASKLEVLDFRAAYAEETVASTRQAIAIGDAAREEVPQLALGSLANRFGFAETIRDPWIRAVSGRYGVNPLAIAAPIRPQARHKLRRLRAASLLSELPVAHFARLALLPAELTDFGQASPDRLDEPYLLFSANHYGPTSTYVEEIRTCGGADAIWGLCAGYPGANDATAFRRWFDRHALPTQYYVAGYAPRPVDEIVRSLDRRASVQQGLARAHAASA